MSADNDITCEELLERMRQGEDLYIIDVREPWEYEQKNIGAQNIPLGMLPAELSSLDHLKSAELIVHCKSGARSAAAKAFLLQQGFANVRNLLGGIERLNALKQ